MTTVTLPESALRERILREIERDKGTIRAMFVERRIAQQKMRSLWGVDQAAWAQLARGILTVEDFISILSMDIRAAKARLKELV